MENRANNAEKRGGLPLGEDARAGVLYSAVSLFPGVLAFVFSLVLAALGDKAGSADALPEWRKYLSFLLPQIGIFAVLVWFSVARRAPVHRTVGWNGFHPVWLAAVALLFFGTTFGLSWLNDLFLSLLEKLGLSLGEVTVPAMTDGWRYAACLVVIALAPAVMEETVFRGALLGGLRETGTAAAALLSGALFSLYHQSPLQTPYQFVCGALYALLALRSGSIVPSFVLHFLNNAFILTLAFAKGVDYRFTGAAFWTLTGVGLAALAAAVVLLVLKGRRCPKTASPKRFLLYAAAGIAFCAVVWIAGLFV